MSLQILKEYRLFRECLEALQVDLLSDDESTMMSLLFKKSFPITRWGKIDWIKISNKISIGYDHHKIITALRSLLLSNSIDTSVYIEWSDGDLPVIKADLQDIIDHFDDVTCVSFEKFIFNPYIGYIVEILPSGIITVGLVEPLCKETV
jgi:hypothetical protein